MHPISFIKAHPVATLVLLGTGYVVVPWGLSKVQGITGVGVTLPQAGQ